jgi:hypothetical protein
MTVSNGKLATSGQSAYNTDYSGVPKTTQTWKIVRKGTDNTQANNGDEVGSVRVHAEVTNGTDKTFVFPNREVVLIVKRNGSAESPLRATVDSSEVPPGGRISADFFDPIIQDGSYEWRVRTYFYEK